MAILQIRYAVAKVQTMDDTGMCYTFSLESLTFC